MGFKNRTLISNGLMPANSSFFKCCTSIFNIMSGSWVFHSAEFYLIRAGNKKYLLLLAYIVKSSYFPRWNSKSYVKFIFCLTIFNLKQDNFQGFWDEIWDVFSVVYGTEFVCLLLYFVQYTCLYFVYICHILLTNLRQKVLS